MAYIGYQPEISMVTFEVKDVAIIKWDFKNSGVIQKYNVYRSSGSNLVASENYTLIGSVNFLDVSGTSSFYKYEDDSVTDTQLVITKYRITAVDVNGVESAPSKYHCPPSKWYNTTWPAYEIEGMIGNWDVLVILRLAKFYDASNNEIFYKKMMFTGDDLQMLPHGNTSVNHITYTDVIFTTYNDDKDWESTLLLTGELDDPIDDTIDGSEYGLISAIPAMTSATSPSGAITASSEYSSSSYPAYYTVDASSSTCWLSSTSNGVPGWLQYDFGVATQIKGYYILPQMWGVEDRSPNSFNLQGSNDGTNWTTLDSRTVTLSEWVLKYADDGEGLKFDIDESLEGNYRYYKLNILSVCGSSLAAIRHFAMYK